MNQQPHKRHFWSKVTWSLLVFLFAILANGEPLNLAAPIWSWSEESWIDKADFSRSGDAVIYVTEERAEGSGLVILRDVHTGKLQCAWDTRGTARAASFSPSGDEVVLELSQSIAKHRSARNLGNLDDYAINTYNVETCSPVRNFRMQSNGVVHVSYSDDGQYLVGVNLPRIFMARIDQPEKIQWIHTSPRKDVRWLRMYKDFTGFLALETSPAFVSIYVGTSDLRNRKRSQVRPRGRWPAAFTMIPDISADDRRLVYASTIGSPHDWKESQAIVRDLETLAQTHTWPIGKGLFPRFLKFIPPSSDSVMSISCDGRLNIHKLLNGKAEYLGSLDIGICPEFEGVGFSSDGKKLLVAGRNLRKEGKLSTLSVFNTEEILDQLIP